jgi:hypothetical protein
MVLFSLFFEELIKEDHNQYESASISGEKMSSLTSELFKGISSS